MRSSLLFPQLKKKKGGGGGKMLEEYELYCICGHTAVEKHKSAKNHIVAMLGILSKVFLSDLLLLCTVKILFVSA